MPRVDVWDVKTHIEDAISIGLPRTFHDRYTFGEELGRGGFGVVRAVTDKQSGQQLACKTIVKKLAVPNLSASKQAQHLEKVKREIEVLRRLRGSLNVAQYRGAFEDDEGIHIVMEWCKGGELWHRIGRAHYSEKTVSSYMRAVLRTISQCHSHRILHRDIKPGNFMLLSDNPRAPLKAIDFGLAVFFDPGKLPRTDLGLEGTPWYMAPEVLECEVGPPADVWSAGVMAYQLLSGNLPFDDRNNPKSPAISRIWQAIFGQEPKFTGSAWADISEEAKDFVQQLLNKDPRQRPTAREALEHPWLRGSSADRGTGKPLNQTVVQRIQRFSQGNVLKKTIFELIAGELLKAATEADAAAADPSGHGAGSGHGMRYFREALQRLTPDSSVHSGEGDMSGSGSGGSRPGSGRPPLGMPRPQSAPGTSPGNSLDGQLPASIPEDGALASSSRSPWQGTHGGGDRVDRHRQMFEEARQEMGNTEGGSAHAGMEFYRPIEGYAGATTSLSRRTAPPVPVTQVAGHKRPASVHGGRAYFSGPALGPLAGASRFRLMRAAAAAGRLSDDGSGAWQEPDYVHVAPRNETERREQRKAARLALDTANVRFASKSSPNLASMSGEPTSRSLPRRHTADERKAQRTDSGRVMEVDLESFPENVGKLQPPPPSPGAVGAVEPPEEGRGRRGNTGLYKAFMEKAQRSSPDIAHDRSGSGGGGPAAEAAQSGAMEIDTPRRSSDTGQARSVSFDESAEDASHHSNGGERHVRFDEDASHRSACSADDASIHRRELEAAFPGGAFPKEIQAIMRRLHFSKEEEGVKAEQLAEGLNRLGYHLEPTEAARLLEAMETGDGTVTKPGFLASQIDWSAFQMDFREQWLSAAKRAFEEIERAGGTGKSSAGTVRATHLIDLLRARLPAAEVDYAVEDALLEAGHANADEIDFDGFLRLLHVGSTDHLDQYESRHGASASHHGGSHFSDLSTVKEEDR